MKLSAFMHNFAIGNKDLVLWWIAEGLLPGALQDPKTQAWSVPERARPPYTKARAKSAEGIYKSIVKACGQRRHVMPKLYKLSEQEFGVYIRQLAKADCIEVVEENGVQYYYSTLKSEEFLKSKKPLQFLEDTILEVTKAVTEGTVSAILKHSP